MTGFTTVSLRTAGVALVVIAEPDALPRVLHWGPDLGTLSAEELTGLVAADRWPVFPNGPDVPLRVSLVPEARFGWTGKPGLIGERAGDDWTPAWELVAAQAEGNDVLGAVVSLGSGRVEFRNRAPGSQLELVTSIELLASGLVKAQARLINQGDSNYRLTELTVALPVPQQARELLDFAGRWCFERAPQRSPLSVGAHRREGRHGRTGADSSYVLSVGETGFGFSNGQIWGAHVAWSGNHVHYAERTVAGAQVVGGGELLLPGEGQLAPGQSYETPEVFFCYSEGLDAGAARFHEYVRSLPSHPKTPRPVTLNVWEAVYFDHDAERLVGLAESAAKLGVERFVLDDGWFSGRRNDHSSLGDWYVSPDMWPQGLHPLTDRVKDLGMEFGLWIEPEMVNLDSEVARAHPDWVMQPAGRLPVESRFQHVLNLSIEGAYQHVLGQLLKVFDEYPIDYVKWDHNRDLIDAGGAGGKAAVAAQTRAFYRLFDALRHAHPEIEFESCSSGGARIDLEVMKRAQRVWVSDNIDPHDRQEMLLWTSQLLPLEVQGSHVASGRSHTTGRWHDLSYRAITAVFGHFGIEWDLAQASAEELAELSSWIEWYKRNREVLSTGKLVRVDWGEPGVRFKGIVSEQKAIYSLAMLDVGPCTTLGRVRLPGLDPKASYQVSAKTSLELGGLHELTEDYSGLQVTATGAALASMGIRAPLLRPDSAVLYEVERL